MKNDYHLSNKMSPKVTRKVSPKVTRLTPCPPALAIVINLANRIPPGPYMRSIAGRMGMAFLSLLPDVHWQNETFELVMSYLKGFPTEVQESFASLASGSGKMAAINHYHEIQQAREKLMMVMRLNQESRIDDDLREPPLEDPFATPFRTYLTSDKGRVKSIQDPFVLAVEGIETSRIRKCANCRRFFWAGRLDQKCCSKKCNSAFRARRYREARQKSRQMK